jgi:polysaccharide biosynthesis transport protein
MKREHTNGFSLNGGGSVALPAAAALARSVDEQTSEQTADPGFDFLQLANILLCRRKLVVTIAAAGVMAAAFLGLLIAPKYTATARLAVEPSQVTDGGPEVPLQTTQLVTEIDTHVTRLASRDYLRRALGDLSGIPEPSATPDTIANETIPPAATLGLWELGRRLKIWVGALASRGPDRELDELERGLRVLQERTSRIISVSFTGKSPEQAAAVANRVVQLYGNSLVEQRRAEASRELAVLNNRAEQLKSELDRATEGMKVLLSRQPSGAARADDGKEREARLNALQREASSVAQAYGEVLAREEVVRSQQEVIVPEVRVLSLASPPKRPSSVNPLLFTFPALIASLIGASLLAIILERLNRPLRSEQDVRDALSLRCIGLVPQLPRSYADRPFHYLQNEPFTPYAESIKSALTALDLAQPCRKPTTILISSSVQGEGKTTVATSLSVCAATLGRRVLLIDFDSRRPSIMRILRGAPQTPASELQDRPLDEFIQHLGDLHLDYLAMPQGKVDPLSPFLSQHVQQFLRGLGSCYDCIFIDGPPLLGVTETRLLAALADSVIFVVKWGGTRREVVQSAGNMLRDALRCDEDNVVRASALVTQVDPRTQAAAYRYGDSAEAYAKYGPNDFARIASPGAVKGNSHANGNDGRDASAGQECAR